MRHLPRPRVRLQQAPPLRAAGRRGQTRACAECAQEPWGPERGIRAAEDGTGQRPSVTACQANVGDVCV